MFITNEDEATQSIETLNERITMSEAELNRLRALVTSENYTVSELVKQKKFEEEEIIRLRKGVDELKNLKDSMASDIADTENKISQAKITEKRAEAKLASAEKRAAEVKYAEDESKEILKKYEEALNTRETDLNHFENRLSKKADIIQEFAQSVAEVTTKLKTKE